jgi:hypothetical protein
VDAGQPPVDAGPPPQCTNVALRNGQLRVTDAAVIDANRPAGFPADCITVAQNLTVNGTVLGNLNGLEYVAAINGNLVITDNLSLDDVSGLANLLSVGGDVTITGNTALSQCAAEAFAATLTVGGTVTVTGNLDDTPCN